MRYHNLSEKPSSKRPPITSVGEGVETREPLYTAGGNLILLQPLWKTVWRFLKNLKIVLPYDPAIALFEIYLKEKKTLIRKETDTQCS